MNVGFNSISKVWFGESTFAMVVWENLDNELNDETP